MVFELTIGGEAVRGEEAFPVLNPATERVLAEAPYASPQRGGTILTGGKRRDGAGYFFDPTLVCGLDDAARLVQEEQFGPVLPVMRFSDVDEAISKANATRFGLGGSVWSTDLGKARDIATRLECGSVWVNQHGVTHPDVPIGGMKWSGIGYENGLAGLDAYTALQTVCLPPE